MERAYHFTSGVNWESIQAVGSLQPYSTPEIPLLRLPINPYTPDQMQRINLVTFFNSEYWKGKFIAAIPESGFDGWREYGLFDRVITRCRDGITNKVVQLSFPIDRNNKAYVREHAHYSPKRFIELYGRDLSDYTTLLLDSEDGDIGILLQQFELCAGSVVRLDEYDGFYEVPELWTPQPIPTDEFQVENQFNFWSYIRDKSM